MSFRLQGLVAAGFTPMKADGAVNPDRIPEVVEFLVGQPVDGIYVCGSTGEGPLLSTDERMAVAGAYVAAAAGRLPVVVQVGHSSLAEAQTLAAHAEQIGADAISAVAPYYFKPGSGDVLLDCLDEITSAAPKLPFYYYHVPAISGVDLDVIELLRQVPERVPSLVGVKYTAPTLDEMQQLIEYHGHRFDILHGRDEMLLAGLAVGAVGAIGSTYNFAAPLYRHLISAFEAGDLEQARQYQLLAVVMIRAVLECGGQAALKAAMSLVGPDCGPVRLPLVSLTAEQIAQLQHEFEAIGVFEWQRFERE
ncbi:MAG: dihydrodipicolinate synthase family protein, partial [Candidatus Nealsonbacteria bacterium]|nr:dihydrodipicolinate synthase family protein [Candidatus Nealsonbacteria bacterium]